MDSSFDTTQDKFCELIVNDRYVICNKIGAGAFGSVYSCRDN